jgi:putative phage-type endonuclease
MNAVTPLPARGYDRRGFIGGSDAGAILGLSPWATPYEVWLEKIGEAKPEDPKKQKFFARRKRQEPVVLEMLLDEKGIKAKSVNTRHFHHAHPFLSCEIDAIGESADLGADLEIEIKTVHPFAAKEWGTEDTDEIPPHYTAQALHGLMVTGRERRLVAALIGVDDLRIYMVERDDETLAQMLEHELAFWKMVQTRTPPPAVKLSDVEKIYGVDKGQLLAIDDQVGVIDSLERIRRLKAEKKETEAEIEKEELVVKSFMKDAAVLTLGAKKACSWKSQVANRIDADLLRAAYPDIAKHVTKVVPSRVFRIA